MYLKLVFFSTERHSLTCKSESMGRDAGLPQVDISRSGYRLRQELGIPSTRQAPMSASEAEGEKDQVPTYEELLKASPVKAAGSSQNPKTPQKPKRALSFGQNVKTTQDKPTTDQTKAQTGDKRPGEGETNSLCCNPMKTKVFFFL